MAIINQSNILNLQPGITAPVVVHMSEGDVGTKLSFKLIDGARAWTDPGNVVAAVHGIRQDGTQFGPYACFISGDVVSFETDAAIAGAAGSGIAEIVLTDSNGNTAGSANFAIMVERATFPHGVTYRNDVSVYEAILAYAQTIPAQVTADYTARIAAEAAAREAADAELSEMDTSLLNQISNEIADRAQQDSVLSGRIDQFARLPDGSLSTAADAELADIRVKANGQTAATAGDAVRQQVTQLNDDLAQSSDQISAIINSLPSEYAAMTPTSTVTDKLFRWTDKSEFSSAGALYSVYTLPMAATAVKISGRNFASQNYSLYAFEDADGNIIEHYEGTNYTDITDLQVTVPAGAKKVYINGQNNATIVALPELKVPTLISVADALDDVNEEINELKSGKKITLSCFGDSTTDGAFVSGNHTADYGKSPYPARLYTILKDAGYNINVNNYGESGERTPDCTIRVGGYPCILTEDITIPADNTPQSLGTITANRGRVFGAKLQIPLKGRDNTNFCVHFTQPATRTGITIDGVEYTVTMSNKTNYIAKATPDNKAVTIPAGSFFFTSNNRNTDVNIICIGINDQYALRMSDWFDMMEKCASASNRFLIVFPWRSMFTAWYDMTGSTAEEKYAEFKEKANTTFGIYLLDLYDLWYRYALDYALASGYLTTLTEEQKTAIREKLANHIIPAEFTYNNTEGETHLNEAGYQVVAMLIAERIKALGYLTQ